MTSKKKPVVCHMLAVFEKREAQARTILRIAESLDAEHHLITSKMMSEKDEFSSVTETGGGSFGFDDANAIRSALDIIRPDVVHFHGGALGSLSVKKWRGPEPVVVSIYLWSVLQPRALLRPREWRALSRTPVMAKRTIANTFLPRSVVMRSLRRCGVSCVITPDDETRDTLSGRGIVVLSSPGVVEPDFNALKERSEEHPPLFVFAGRAESSRGAVIFAEAASLLHQRGVEARYRFCLLDTGMAEKVRGSIQEAAGSAPIEITIGGDNLSAEMRTARGLVLPFRYNYVTMSPNMVAAEALAAGIPVIGGDVACIRSVVSDNENGFLVPVDDPSAVAVAIERLCDNSTFERLSRGAISTTRENWERFGLRDAIAWSYRLASGEIFDTAPRTTATEHPETIPAHAAKEIL